MSDGNPTREGETSGATAPHATAEEEFDLLDLLIALAKHRKIVLGVPFAAAVLAAGISLLMPNIYTSTARILPPHLHQSATAAILGQLTGLATTIGDLPGIKNPSDLYVGMLKSQTVADRVIDLFKLQELYEKDTLVETRRALSEVTSISAGKDGIITIEVEDKDPKQAAGMANAYVRELERLNESLALTDASQRRLFFEKQLKQAKDALAAAEIELKKTQEKTGLIKLDDQGKAIIEAVAQLRAQVAAKEVQIGAMKSFATERNPDLVRVQQELAGLREQLRKLERDKLSGDGDILVPTGRVPEAGLEYIRGLRDVKYYETLFELVAKHYEIARLDEAKDASLIQVLDRALPPDKKSKPKRALIVIATGLVTAMVAAFWAYLHDAAEKSGGSSDRARRVELLKRYLGRNR